MEMYVICADIEYCDTEFLGIDSYGYPTFGTIQIAKTFESEEDALKFIDQHKKIITYCYGDSISEETIYVNRVHFDTVKSVKLVDIEKANESDKAYAVCAYVRKDCEYKLMYLHIDSYGEGIFVEQVHCASMESLDEARSNIRLYKDNLMKQYDIKDGNIFIAELDIKVKEV